MSAIVKIEGTAKREREDAVVASTHGNQITTAMVNGKPVVLGLNAYIKH